MIEKLKRNWLLIVLILFSLIPIIWFLGKGDILINGLDTNFPLDPTVWFKRRLFVWNDVASGGINFASSTAGIFFHLVQVIPYVLGLNLHTTQILSLVFWFSLLVFSAYYFSSKVFIGNKIAQLVFVTTYVFNIYLFNTWENVKVANLAVVVALPLFLGVFTSYINKEIKMSKLLFYTAVVSLISSGSGINPAYFITIIGGLVVFAITQKKLKILLIMLGVICLVNSFWIVPTANNLVFSQNSATLLSDIGFTNWLDSLSEHTSFFNIFRFQGAWDWYATDDVGAPLYIPYASNYFNRLPFLAFSVLLSALVIVGFLTKEKEPKKYMAFFGIMLVLGLFLGSGTHTPTGVLYKFLTEKVPFFSFFRSPWYIFTPYLMLASSSMISYVFFLKKDILKYLAVILIIGNLIYVYPLITGKIYRPQKQDSFFVKFPEYVFDTRKWLKDQGKDGRILSYPKDEIENFRWGYRGIESILNLITSDETIFSSLNNGSSPSSKMISSVYLAFQRNQIEIAESLAAKLNVSTIFVKKDQSTLWDITPIGIENYDKKTIGEWQFYEIPKNKYLSKIYFSDNLFYGFPSNNIDKVVGAISDRESVVSSEDSIIKRIPRQDKIIGNIVIAQNSQQEDFDNYQKNAQKQSLYFSDRDLNQIKYSIEITNDGLYQPVLESFMLDTFGVDLSNGLKVKLDGQEQIWKIKKLGDLVLFDDIRFTIGTHNIILNVDNKNILASDKNIINLSNREDKEKSEIFQVKPFVGYYPYLVEFDYKNMYGGGSFLRLEQKGETVNYKFQTEAPQFSPEKIHFSFYFDPIAVPHSYLLIKPSISAIVDSSLGTKVEYSNISIHPIITNKMFFIQEPEEITKIPKSIDFNKVSPVLYKGQVFGSHGSHVIIFSENYSPDWELKLFNMEDREINYIPLHFSANLYANAWFIEDLSGDYKFEIYYKPQVIYNVFIVVSVGTLISLLGYYLWDKFKK